MTKKQKAWMQAVISRGYVSGYLIRRLIDPELAKRCNIVGEQHNDTKYQVPELTREDLFDMLRIVSPEDALALMCGLGITSAGEAQLLLEQNGLHSVLSDNNAEVDEAISRRADLALFLDNIKYRKIAMWRFNMECSWADLAELYGTSLRDMEVEYGMADGDTTWSFIKQVGIANIRKFPEELLALEGVFSPTDIKQLVARANQDVNNPAERYESKRTKAEKLKQIVSTAKRIGVQDAISLRTPSVCESLGNVVGPSKVTPEACRFVDEFIHSDSDIDRKQWNYGKLYAFHNEGYSVAETIVFIKEGIDVEIAVGIRDNAIPSAVSKGWL